MLILIGYLVVLGTVFGGYMMTGGHLGALYQPAELIIIGGAGVGAFIVGNNGKAIKGTLKALPLLFRRSKYTKTMYMDLLALLYRLMAKSRQQGMFSLERDIENPKESEIFASYPRILADKVMLEFIVDYLRLIISGNMNTFEIEALMDEEIETHESECEVPANSLALVGDSADGFPGLKGWGPKSAATLLARFGHIEAIPDDHRAWGIDVARAATLAATLVRERDLALLFKDLATLRTDVPVFDSVDALEWRGPTPALAALRRRLAVDDTD